MIPRPTILVIPALAALVASDSPQTGAIETPTLALETPMRAPAWAFAARALLEANADGAAAFAEKYLDEAGHLRTEERWGVSDGPDDAMETIRLWPLFHAQVRHVDPARRRPGLPENVAVLVKRIATAEVTLTLVNTNPLRARTVVVQTGAYAEHEIVSLEVEGRTVAVGARHVTVRLAPGAGGTITIRLKRFAHQPTLAFPWDRS